MTTYRRRVLRNTLKVFDLLLTMGAFLLATLIALPARMSLEEFLSMRVSLGNLVLFSLMLLMWHLAYASCGLYDSRRMLGCLADVRDALKAALAGTVLIGIAGFGFHVRMFSTKFLIIFWIAACCASIASRVLLHTTLGKVRKHGRNLRHILIVGTGARAIEFARTIESKPEMGYRIMGFVDRPWAGSAEFSRSGYSILCGFEGLEEILRISVVDEVVIALPIRSLHMEAASIAAACEMQGIT